VGYACGTAAVRAAPCPVARARTLVRLVHLPQRPLLALCAGSRADSHHDVARPAQGKVRAFHLAMVADEFGERPETEWNRCKTGVIPSRAPYV